MDTSYSEGAHVGEIWGLIPSMEKEEHMSHKKAKAQHVMCARLLALKEAGLRSKRMF